MFVLGFVWSSVSGLANAGWRQFRFSKRWLAPLSGLWTADADSKDSEKGNELLVFVLCLFLVLFGRQFRVWQTLARAIVGFSKCWLAHISDLANAGWRHFRV